MIGHLGTRVSALLDGQLPQAEADRAWAHVHACHLCRDLVEREGWIKTRLSGLSGDAGTAPDHLKGSLRCGATMPAGPAGWGGPASGVERPRRVAALMIGGSAAGVAVLGVLALGIGPTGGTPPERQAPVTNVGGSDSSRPVPARVPGRLLRESSPSPLR